MGHIRKEIKGNRYGRFTALGERKYKPTLKGKNVILEKCVCDCGKEKRIRRCNLLNGLSRSCGCFRDEYIKGKPSRNRTHGMTRTRIYKIFHGAKNRCTDTSNNRYQNYGGRGIRFLWNSFEDFYNDMGESYISHVCKYGEKDTTIDRIDVDGDYCKDNCKRSTMKEQQNNRSNNLISNSNKDVSIQQESNNQQKESRD